MRACPACWISCLVLMLAPVAATGAPTPGSGFKMPSGLVTCRIITDTTSELFCGATYITKLAYDGVGVVRLPRSARARIVPSGNDMLLLLGGYDPNTGASLPRRTLAYGRTWSAAGYRCTSRRSGLTCTRGGHGFFLSKERQRFF